MKRALFLLLLALPFLAQDRNPADYERYLVPVHAAVPGAYGAQWRTTIYLRNDGSGTLDVFPLSPDCISSVACFRNVRAYPAFRPRQSGFHPVGAVPFFMHPSASGRFFYVQREGGEQLSMRLSVADVSRTPAGNTEIPIVPESAFFDTPRSILGVPVVEGTRVALRVYTADPRPEATITVRLEEMGPQRASLPPGVEPLFAIERTFAFTYDPAQDTCGFVGCPEGVRYIPSIVQINNLLDAFPELATLRPLPYGLRIEIAPDAPGLRYWPLVTATRDVDGFVSVFTVR